MTEDAAGRVHEMVASLRRTTSMTITRWAVQPPATPAALGAARRAAQGRLPEGVEDFYRQMDGFALEWEHAPDDGAPDLGAIQLLPVERVFGDWKGVTWFDDLGGDGGPFRGVKPFDLFQAEACAAFVQDPTRPPRAQVHFHVFGEGLCDTGRTFPEYLSLLLASRGYLYWQQLLCAETTGNPDADRCRTRLPQLFPEVDLGAFTPRAGPDQRDPGAGA